jgi:hypothetical protein
MIPEAPIPVSYTRRNGFGPLVPEYSTRSKASNSNDAMQGRQEHGSLAAELQRRRELAASLPPIHEMVEPVISVDIVNFNTTTEEVFIEPAAVPGAEEYHILAPTMHSHDAA